MVPSNACAAFTHARRRMCQQLTGGSEIRLQQGMQLAAQGGPHGLPAQVHRVRARQAAGHQVRGRTHALLVGLEGKVLHSQPHAFKASVTLVNRQIGR